MQEKIFLKEVPSDPDLLPELEEFIIEVANKAALSKDKLNNLALSFSEAVSNSIVHGNKLDKTKKIRIIVKIEKQKLIIILKDEGKGFDLKTVPDPTKQENIFKESGRGIHIMRNFLDDLRYNFTPDGTETILEISLV